MKKSKRVSLSTTLTELSHLKDSLARQEQDLIDGTRDGQVSSKSLLNSITTDQASSDKLKDVNSKPTLDVLELSKKLTKLGFAGSISEQRFFAEEMESQIINTETNPHILAYLFSGFPGENDALNGHEVLTRLICCTNFEDKDTADKANGALNRISQELPGIIFR